MKTGRHATAEQFARLCQLGAQTCEHQEQLAAAMGQINAQFARLCENMMAPLTALTAGIADMDTRMAAIERGLAATAAAPANDA